MQEEEELTVLAAKERSRRGYSSVIYRPLLCLIVLLIRNEFFHFIHASLRYFVAIIIFRCQLREIHCRLPYFVVDYVILLLILSFLVSSLSFKDLVYRLKWRKGRW